MTQQALDSSFKKSPKKPIKMVENKIGNGN